MVHDASTAVSVAFADSLCVCPINQYELLRMSLRQYCVNRVRIRWCSKYPRFRINPHAWELTYEEQQTKIINDCMWRVTLLICYTFWDEIFAFCPTDNRLHRKKLLQKVIVFECMFLLGIGCDLSSASYLILLLPLFLHFCPLALS